MLFCLILHVWWLLGIILPESGFCWKKRRQVNISAELQKSRNQFWRSYNVRCRRQPGGPHATPGRGWPMGRAQLWHGHLGPPPRLPLCVYLPPENLSTGGTYTKYSAASTGRKPPREKELSGREILPGKFPPEEGKSSPSSSSSHWTSSGSSSPPSTAPSPSSPPTPHPSCCNI